MKKYFVLAVLFISVFSFSVKAAEIVEVSRTIQESFNKEFEGATYVKWELIKDKGIYQARFLYNNERLNAFFDNDGSFIAVGRFIAEPAMPLMVSKAIAKKYPGHKVKGVQEYVKGVETSYLVTLENDKTKLIVNVNNTGSSYVVKKEKINS